MFRHDTHSVLTQYPMLMVGLSILPAARVGVNRSFHCSVGRRVIEKYDVFENSQAEVCVEGYNEFGFQVEGCDVYYSLFILPYASFLWNVPSIELLKPEHFALLEIIPPIGLWPC